MARLASSVRTAITTLSGMIVLLAVAAEGSESITIVANPGRFGTVEQAATAEKQINWWDDNLADDTACTESFAATELRHFLAAFPDRDESSIRLAVPDQMPPTGDVFLIGSGDSNPLIASLEPVDDKYSVPPAAGSFRIRALKQGGRKVTVLKGSDCVGALYGVYAYLETLGVRFFGLGEQDTVFPKGMVKFPQDLDLIEQPDYVTRGFWAWENRGDRTFFRWMARNRMNFWCVASKPHIHFLKKLGLKLTAGQHDIQLLCLGPQDEYPYNHPKFDSDDDHADDPYVVGTEYGGDTNGDGKLTYFEAHPEWYGLHNDKRSDDITDVRGVNYCTSNSDATRELANNVVQHLIGGAWKDADILNFWMLDGGMWCECENCKKQGSYTDRLLIVMDATLKAMKAAQAQGRLKRDVSISSVAYIETLAPPTRPLPEDFDYDNFCLTFFPIRRCYVHSLADPACTEVNQSICRDLKGWTTGPGRLYRGSILIGEYYNISVIKSLPVLFARIMATDIPWYYRMGARHFHYMHAPTRLWGTWRLNHYLMARLLWDANADVDLILDEYLARCYPTTAKRMRTFYRELEYASANIKAFKHKIEIDGKHYWLRNRLADDKLEMFPYDHLHYEAHHSLLNNGPDVVEMMDAMRRARRQIDDALIECTDAAERLRLMEDERRFAYGEAMFRFYYRLVRTAMFHRRGDERQARNEFAMASRQATILENVVDLVQVASSHANATNGLVASFVLDAYERFGKLYGADTARLEEEAR